MWDSNIDTEGDFVPEEVGISALGETVGIEVDVPAPDDVTIDSDEQLLAIPGVELPEVGLKSECGM